GTRQHCRDSLLPPAAVLCPRPGTPPADHAGIPGPGSPHACPRWVILHPDRQPGLLALHPRSGAGLLRVRGTRTTLARCAQGTDTAGDHCVAARAAGVSRFGEGPDRVERGGCVETRGNIVAASIRCRRAVTGIGWSRTQG